MFTSALFSIIVNLLLCEVHKTQPVISQYSLSLYVQDTEPNTFQPILSSLRRNVSLRDTTRDSCPRTINIIYQEQQPQKMHLPTPHLLLLALSALSSTTLATPSYRQLRSLQVRSSYTCPGPAPSCQNCTVQENRCLGLAASPVYEEVESCIVQAQECYFSAENADIYGRYGCSDAHTTCVSDGGPEDFCDTQLAACQACETGYDDCRGCPHCVTTEECQESSVACFMNAVSLNGTVTPRSPGDS